MRQNYYADTYFMKDRVYKMLRDNRIRYIAPADYNAGSELDELVKAIIDKTAAYEKLENKHVKDHNEAMKV